MTEGTEWPGGIAPAIVRTGISGGVLLLGLAELDHYVGALPEGELRDRWAEAARTMRAALDDAMRHHELLTGHVTAKVTPWEDFR